MASRDTSSVVAGLGAWLAARHPGGAVEVLDHHHPAVGFSSETIILEVRRDGAGATLEERLVAKLAPAGAGIFPHYDFHLQAAVQTAVAVAGIPVAVPVEVEDDPSWVGAPFLMMPAVAGHIPGEVALRDPWLTGVDPARTAEVHRRYADVLADVHRVDWEAAGLAGVVAARDLAAELGHWRRYLEWYGDGDELVPALAFALDWCEAHQPTTEPAPALLWGDVRLGNVVFDEAGLPVAVLDWEMATVGAPEHDLAWTLALEGVQAELFGRTVPGFLDRRGFIERYQARLGRPVVDLAWYEVLAIVRSTAVMTRVAHLQEQAGRPPTFPVVDNPILGILARRMAAAEVALA